MNSVFILLGIAATNAGISMRVVEPMLPRLAHDFGASIAATSVIITTFAVAQSAAQYVHGPLGDRYGRLRVVTILLALAALTSLATAMVQDLTSMAVWRFLTGALVSGTMTLGMSYLADTVPPEERQPVLARFVSGTIIGQSIGPFVGGALTDLFGWRATFWFLAAVFALVSFTLFASTRSRWAGSGKKSPGALFSPVRHLSIIRRRHAKRVLAVVFLELFFLYACFSFLGVMLREKFDLSFTLVGTVLAGFGMGGLVYILFVRIILAHLGQRGCVSVGGVVSGLALAGAAVAPWWPLVMLCTMVLGFAFYMMHNTVQTKGTEMAPDMRTTGVALFSMCWAGGQATGVAVMGAAIGIVGYVPLVLLFAAALAGLGLWLRSNLHQLEAPRAT